MLYVVSQLGAIRHSGTVHAPGAEIDGDSLPAADLHRLVSCGALVARTPDAPPPDMETDWRAEADLLRGLLDDAQALLADADREIGELKAAIAAAGKPKPKKGE